MRTPTRILLALALLTTLSLSMAQERVKKKGPPDFKATHAALAKAWDAGHYGQSLDLTRELLQLIMQKRAEVIRAALPAAPEGWEVVPEKPSTAGANPMAAAMAASIGNVVERKYRASEGGGRVDVTVTADSPLGQMFKMWAANPAMLGEDAELIKYESCDAVLKKEGSRWVLQVLVGDDLCEVRVQGESDEFLLKLFDQAAIDTLARALAD